MSNWFKFSYNESIHGVYWAIVETPVYAVDCDDYGKTVGTPTGEVDAEIMLLEIHHEPEDFTDLRDVENDRMLGDESIVKSWMPLEKPSFPMSV